MKKILIFLKKNPAYLGFIGAIVGVLLGGLISFTSSFYNKNIDLKEAKKRHIEELYLNLCFSFSVFKDRLIINYLNDWDMYLSEKTFSYSKSSIEDKEFYRERFLNSYKNMHSDINEFSEIYAKFQKDYNSLKLYINLNKLDNFFCSRFDLGISQKIILFKRLPQSTLALISAYQQDSLYSILDQEIEKLNMESDSVFSIIHEQVSTELKK